MHCRSTAIRTVPLEMRGLHHRVHFSGKRRGENVTMNIEEKPCPNCGAVIDDLTAIVHREVHKTPWTGEMGLDKLAFSLMPHVARILEIFGTDLIAWMDAELKKGDHCCITGDCPHESQVECWSKFVHDCAADLRAKHEQEQKKEPSCTPRG